MGIYHGERAIVRCTRVGSSIMLFLTFPFRIIVHCIKKVAPSFRHTSIRCRLVIFRLKWELVEKGLVVAHRARTNTCPRIKCRVGLLSRFFFEDTPYSASDERVTMFIVNSRLKKTISARENVWCVFVIRDVNSPASGQCRLVTIVHMFKDMDSRPLICSPCASNRIFRIY